MTHLDFNLVAALRALLEERNVTRAAARLGLSQPAMSAALARLRRHYGDPLLTRAGNAYELTPLAAILRERSAAACDMLDRVFSAQASFDPAEPRDFTLACSDYGAAVFGAALARVLHEHAPQIRLHLRHLSPALVENAATVLSTIDGMVLPHGVIDGLPAVELYQDRWVCLIADDHPDVPGGPTLDDLNRLPWVVYQRAYDAPVARQLSMMGTSPRVEVYAPTFQLLPLLVEKTRRVALIQERLARLSVGGARVRVEPCPFPAVPVQMALWWHPHHKHDPAHIWLRERATEVGQALREAPEPSTR
ncbi:LysR family transcriptional regulator [Nonomuraea sp. NPDC049141]|uniref:LysR family transcriptional regulator n=1 Tax=Nonomuraea sp. NPDC049141 TaxID=3155500 RepID=UPI0033F3F605